MTDTKKTILVTGATGTQGGATIRHLLAHGGFALRALTRKPGSPAAQALAAQGVTLVEGNLDDEASLAAALEGAWGAFGVQNTWEAGVEGEEAQGKRLVAAARKAGVQHFVYTSVGSAHKATGIPHFDNKYRVEQALKAADFPSHVIIRPVFFMENLPSPWFLQPGDLLMTAMKPDTKLQMIASDDIGKFAARAFIDHERHNRAEVDLAGDAITMTEAAAGLSRQLGRTITFQPIPIEAVRANSDDFALMLEWFESTGYSADIASLEGRFGFKPKTFAEWLASRHA